MFNKPERAEKIVKITIDLFKTQKVESIKTYINFLKFIPDNDDIIQILTLALEKIVETDLETIYWLLEHSHLLSSDGNIRAIISNLLKEKILFLSFSEQEFDFKDEGFLRLNTEIQENMLASSHLDKFFFQSILNILSETIVALKQLYY